MEFAIFKVNGATEASILIMQRKTPRNAYPNELPSVDIGTEKTFSRALDKSTVLQYTTSNIQLNNEEAYILVRI